MRLVVCLRQVFDPGTVRVTSRGELSTQDGARLVNPADLCALEEALRISDDVGAEVVVVAMGDAEEELALREALAMGAGRAILLQDAAFAGSDAAGVSYALARAIAVLGSVDIALIGAHRIDDGETQTGPAVAEHLGWRLLAGARDLRADAIQISALQRHEDGACRVTTALPAVVTVDAAANTPRLAPAAAIMNVYSKHIVETWTAAGIGADAGQVGSDGARTVVRRTFPPDPVAKGDILTGQPDESARALAARLRKRGFI